MSNNNVTWVKFNIFVKLSLSFLFLISVGLAAVASASFNFSLTRYDQSFHYFAQQLVAAIVCFFMIFIVSFVKVPKKFNKFRNYKYFEDDKVLFTIYMVSIVLLILVPIIGQERNGAKRWIFGIQPSEFIKISYILYCAKLMTKLDNEDTDNLVILIKKYWLNFFLLALLP